VLGDASGIAYTVPLMNSFNQTEVAMIPMQAMLRGAIPVSQICLPLHSF